VHGGPRRPRVPGAAPWPTAPAIETEANTAVTMNDETNPAPRRRRRGEGLCMSARV
jgi:hypothetical protein